MIRPSVPTSHPALGVAKATAQKPLTPGNVNQVFPSSGVQAAVPVENVGGSFAVITTATSSSDIAQAENRACYRRGTGERPCHTAITRYRGARIIGISRIQIAAA